MNDTLKYWLKAIRPHTLPLAVSASGMGSIAAACRGKVSFGIVLLSILTAVLLQILSNLSNDFGDFKHGVDNESRKGPERSLQSGKITVKQMKIAIKIVMLTTLLSGVGLLIISVNHIGLIGVVILLLIGFGSIWAAYAYTAALKPYGYYGFGDLFVFVFFGLVAVLGTAFLHSGKIILQDILPAFALGFGSVGVLNFNNIRDMENDASSGKKTIAIILGFTNARIYQFVLLGLTAGLLIVYTVYIWELSWKLFFVSPVLLLFTTFSSLKSPDNYKLLYSGLRRLSISLFLITLSLTLGLII